MLEDKPIEPVFGMVWRHWAAAAKPEEIEEFISATLEMVKLHGAEDLKYLEFIKDITIEQQTALLKLIATSRFAGAVSPILTIAAISRTGELTGNKELVEEMVKAGEHVLKSSARAIQNIMSIKGGE